MLAPHGTNEGSALTALAFIAALGAFALLVSRLARRFVPEIVVFLALGIAIGPEGPVRLINNSNIRSLELVTLVALGLIIFLLGDRLRFDGLRDNLGALIPLNLVQILVTAVLVFAASVAVGADRRLAFVLAVIAAETGVLTVTATVREERAAGGFTDLLLASVGLTNVMVAIAFGFSFPFVLAAAPDVSGFGPALTAFLQIVVASTVIGIVAGWLVTRIGASIETSGELLLFIVLVVIGVAALDLMVNGSVVVSTLLAGVFVANRSPWLADRVFVAVRTLEAPIYLVFFVVAGAGIHLDELGDVGLAGAAYLVARTVGKWVGSYLGGRAARPRVASRPALRLGVGMLPHAGMAIALVAFVVEQAPGLAEDVSAIVLGSIVVFELAGPLVLRRALRASGEAGAVIGTDVTPGALAEHRTFTRLVIPMGNLVVAMPRLPFLFDLVGTLGAQLVVVHVTAPGARPRTADEPEILKVVSRLARERNIDCVTRHKESEHIAAAIAETVHEEEADLVVMGEPLRASVFERSHWGRNAQRVARLIDVPMLVYPVDPHDPGAVPASYRRLVHKAVSVDQDIAASPDS